MAGMLGAHRFVALLLVSSTLGCSSARISGEVFATAENGHVWPAAGADVLVIPSAGKNWADFTRSLNEKQVQGKWHETQAGNDIDFKSEGGYCSYLWHGGVFYYFGQYETATTSGQDGRFELEASRGRHIVFVAGQAGDRCAVWADEISPGWRGQTIRLANPLCTYKAEVDPAHSC
jgi:hypothetical protein